MSGDEIKALRLALNSTQADFALAIGVCFATVNRWENEQTRPSRLALTRLYEIREEAIRDGVFGPD